MSKLLDQAAIHRLFDAVSQARLSPESLRADLPPEFVPSLRTASTPRDQLLWDLQDLNGAGRLTDGTVPLLVWLKTAIVLSGLQPERAVFEEALRAATAAPPVPAPPGAPHGKTGEAVHRGGAVVVYVSYALQDESYFDALDGVLTPLQRSGALELRHRRQAPAGGDARPWMRTNLDEARLVILLMSREFIRDAVTWEEMNQALANERNGTRVVPILVRRTDLRETPLAGRVSLPRGEIADVVERDPEARRRALRGTNDDVAFTEIVGEIRQMLPDLRAQA